jgi:hypothetical protein
MRHHRPAFSSNYNRNAARPLNNNNAGSNRQDRRFVSPSQNRPTAPGQNAMTCNYCKKPGHLLKDCYRYKARVDTGLIMSDASQLSGNRASPLGARGDSQRYDAMNRPKIPAATRRPALAAVNEIWPTTPARPKAQPSSATGQSSCSHAKKQIKGQGTRDQKEKEIRKKPNKMNHQESDSDSEADLSELFQ